MAPQRKFLDELDTSSKSYKVKDDKKNRMKMTLFGDQIDAYKDVILFRGNYDISNDLKRPLHAQYRAKESDLPFQMTIGSRTLIQSLDPEGEQVFPRYQSLASVPRVSTDDVRHDILVIVMYIADEPKKIVTTLNKESSVRDLMVIDHSTDSPVKVCTWNDLSGKLCETLVSESDNFKVIGITALRPITRKGFQLESSMSTVIIESPEGEKAAALTEWERKHRSVLIEHQNRVTAAWNPPAERILTTIAHIKTKKVNATIQELCAAVSQPSSSSVDNNNMFRFHFHDICFIMQVAKTLPQEVYWLRVTASDIQATITFTASDGTGALQLTAFTENSVPLLGMSAADIYHMKALDDTTKFGQIANKLRNTYFLLKIGPTTALEQNKVLQWGIKGVEMEDTITPNAARSSSEKSAYDDSDDLFE
uniref:Replication protein A OB domain-containing protein n=1 Tax=Chenopodium quinoa TaxID=63459 RepID=A0A803MI29_CHEQI